MGGACVICGVEPATGVPAAGDAALLDAGSGRFDALDGGGLLPDCVAGVLPGG